MTAARMRTVGEPGGVRRQVRAWRRGGERVVFVPTMGALHEGHLSLLRRARRLGDRVVLSIFVNPTQFGPTEDLKAYPRDLARDLKLARKEGVDLAFTPTTASMYRPGRRTEVRVTGLEGVLEGKTRPTHFAGVALVVLKLLHIVEPDVLVLGQKDAQQALVLETLVRDLDLPVRVARAPTVRERDGLALSSRNAYLSPAERAAAPALARALRLARESARTGERSAARILRLVRSEIAREPRLRLDYAEAVDARTLEPLKRLQGRVLLPAAVFVGRTRLIDNVEFTVPRRAR
jgi:pantoate--beta-alanine ligase